jgi:hypothetical protein
MAGAIRGARAEISGRDTDMKPVAEIRQETAEVLGSAVAEVAKRAIRPELDPFKQSLESLVSSLESHAEALDEQVRAEKKALDAVNKQLGEVISVGKGQAAAAAETQTRIQDLEERLNALASNLARTCDEHATTVAALNTLREEVLGWVQTSHEQATHLTAVLGRTESLAEVLDNQAGAFAGFSSTLLDRVETRTTEVLSDITQARADVSREASALKLALETGFKGQTASARSDTKEVMGKLDVAMTSITAAVGLARDTSVAKVDALDVAQQKRQDAAVAELKVLAEALRSELAMKSDAGLQKADRIDTRITEVLSAITQVCAAVSSEASALELALEAGFEGQTTSARSDTKEVIGKLDAAMTSITAAVGLARDTSAAEVAALDVAQQKRQDVAAAELKVLVGMVRVKLPSYIKAELNQAVTEQIKSVHSEAQTVLGKIDAAEKSIAFAVESARRMGANELDALGDKQQSHHDKAVAELKVLLEALRPDLATKIETGLQQTVNRLEPGNQRALDQIGSLRSSVEMQGAAILTEFGVVLGKLNARHEDHGRELVKTGQMAGRVFRLAVANLFLVLVALALGGFALWQIAK